MPARSSAVANLWKLAPGLELLLTYLRGGVQDWCFGPGEAPRYLGRLWACEPGIEDEVTFRVPV